MKNEHDKKRRDDADPSSARSSLAEEPTLIEEILP
jgi:hypothetical protein